MTPDTWAIAAIAFVLAAIVALVLLYAICCAGAEADEQADRMLRAIRQTGACPDEDGPELADIVRGMIWDK